MAHEFNTAPEGMKEISLEEFTKHMFHYVLGQPDSKQVTDPRNYGLRMFPLGYGKEKEDLGFAIMNDWFNDETKKNRDKPLIRFFRYGSREKWNKFTAHFIGQFQGDNS